jgi:hypothetical protein
MKNFETGRIHAENNKIEVEAVSITRTEPSMRYTNNHNKTNKSIFTKVQSESTFVPTNEL